MEHNKDNIELRSDKVRSIIGQIPPWIIRSGITVILLVIITLLIGSYYFKYPYTITTSVEFVKNDNSFTGYLKIPANEISKIKKGQEVKIYFVNIENINGYTFKSKLSNISNNITIHNKNGFYKAEINKIDNLNITEKINGIAIIKTNEISLFQRVIKPFKTLKNNNN